MPISILNIAGQIEVSSSFGMAVVTDKPVDVHFFLSQKKRTKEKHVAVPRRY